MDDQERARWVKLIADFESSDLTQREFGHRARRLVSTALMLSLRPKALNHRTSPSSACCGLRPTIRAGDTSADASCREQSHWHVCPSTRLNGRAVVEASAAPPGETPLLAPPVAAPIWPHVYDEPR
jgi:hypothetical protein